MKSKSLFISYASQDKDLADHVLAFLESNGLQCWIAPRDIPPASDWAEFIIDGIDSASGMVLILSKHSNVSPQVRREVERAVSKGIDIYPLIVESIDLSKWMQYYISAHQWHDATDVPLSRKLAELLSAIQSLQNTEEIEPDFSNLSELLENDLTSLSSALDVEEKESERLLPAERRKVSVLHIVTDLSDNEVSPSVKRTVSKTVVNLIERFAKTYGGYLDLKSPDNYRCIFGMKQVQEDDSKRALSCGICLFNGFAELNYVLKGKNLSIDFGFGLSSGVLEVDNTGEESIHNNGEVLSEALHLSKIASNELLANRSVYDLTKEHYCWEEHSKDIFRISDYSISLPKSRMISVHSSFVGRKKELAKLDALLKQQEKGTEENNRYGLKHLVTGIKGKAGIGKTRLVHEFLFKFHSTDDYLILEGQTLSFAQPPYWLWTTLLRNMLGIELGSELSYQQFLNRLKNYSHDKTLLESASFLADLLSIESGDNRLVQLDAKAIVLETKIAFCNLFKAISENKKLVIVLEDLHWMNESDRSILEFITSNTNTKSPIVFLLLYRPEREDDSIVEFTILPSYTILNEITISEVNKNASTELIKLLLANISAKGINHITSEAEKFISDRSAGNPFYLEELIFYMFESDLLIETNTKWQLNPSSVDCVIPDSLTGLLQSRLDRLPVSWKSVLQNSSVLGMEFQLKLYRKLANKLFLGRPRADIFDGLERKQMLLNEKTAFEKKYFFRHILVHNTAYLTILEGNLKKLHKAAAETIEEMLVYERDRIASVLLFHYEKAGEINKTIEWGMKALGHYSGSDAINLSYKLENLLMKQKDTAQREETLFKLLYKRGKALEIQGKRKEQKLNIEQMEKSSKRFNNKYNIALTLKAQAVLAWLTGRLNDAQTDFEEALELAHQIDDHSFEGIILGNLGSLFLMQGQMDKAQEFYDKAITIHRGVKDQRSEAIILMNLGILNKNTDRFEKALSKYKQALEIAQKIGDRRSIGDILGNYGSLYWYNGYMEKAKEYYEKALEKNEEISNYRTQGITLGNLALLHKDLNQPEEALKCYEKALKIVRDINDRSTQGSILGNLGTLHADLGRFDIAEEYYEKALKIHQEVGNRRYEGIALGNLGISSMRNGLIDKAKQYYTNSLEIHREVKNYREEGLILIRYGSLFFKENNFVEANQYYLRACKIISDHELDSKNFDSFIDLRRDLLSAGYSEKDLSWPTNWDQEKNENES